MTIQEADLRDQIRAGRFEPVVECPHTPQKPYLKPNADSKAAKEWAEELEEWEADVIDYKLKLKEYREHRNRLDDTFKKAALQYVGLLGHPKADRAWGMAIDQSRSDGKIAILDTLEEYADLIL
jgi:hypothetical protein